MRKYLLIVVACLAACLTQMAAAYEYVFDMSKAIVDNTTPGTNIITLKQTTSTGRTLYFEIKYNSVEECSACEVVNGKLAVKSGVQFTFRCLDRINEVMLGTIPSDANDQDYQFGNEVTGILDYNGIGTLDNVFIAGRSNNFNAGSYNFSCNIYKTWSGDVKTWYVGPTVVVRTEPISSEELTHADHNVYGQYHTLTDDLVGVDVVEVGPSWNKVSYLICRSANPISDLRKHKQGSQELLKDASGNTPAYADPNTVQYSWIGLKLANPESYIGVQFKGVRGQYVPDGVNGTDEYYNYRMFNPIMQVVGTPTKVAENVETVLNDYTVANLEEQDNKRYFFMEPRPFELCNVIDVMRTNAQGIKTPSKAAIMPDGKTENIYVDNEISGFAAIIDPQYDTWKDSDMELFKVSTEWEAQALAWRCENKIYDIPNALVFFATFDKNDNPLDIPNRDYYNWASDKSLGIHIQGKAKIREYEQDMVVGDGDHWSRYEYSNNINAYRNDLNINIYNPTTNLSRIGNLSVVRCDNEGNELTKIATIEQNPNNNEKFTVSYINTTQTAINDVELAKISIPRYEAQEFQIKESAIGISDMFYSEEMNSREANSTLYPGYQYRVVPAEGNPNDNLTCVVSFAPVYKTNENVVTRANYSQADVDGDIDNTLVENNKAKINFTPNMAKAMTEYRIYKGDDAQGEIFNNIASNAIVLDNNFLSEAIEDYIVDGTVYVPELYTEYNDNTYGCYKQSVSDASVGIYLKSQTASVVLNSNGTRYVQAILDLSSIINNIDKDSRYLVRVWRQVGNGEKVLLNNEPEKVGGNYVGEGYDWQTNYTGLELMGMSADEYAKEQNPNPFELHDTFLVHDLSSSPSGAPHLMADDDNVTIEQVNYYVTLYVKDDASGKYYVKTAKSNLDEQIPTAITTITSGAQVESVRYYNVAGVESSKPFAGMNIVVTRYNDGSSRITKLVKQ